ncbi:MAG: serine/threonine protein kinase, partial [Planctomycetales bacterium]
GIPKAQDRFLREAKILGELDHPRIVRLGACGNVKHLLFIEMELVDTIELEHVWKRCGPQGRVSTACLIVCQMLDALHYAHSRGVVHRDIKPTNILLTRENDQLFVKLADFGLAKNYQESELSHITESGDVHGSTAFMSPEQIIDCRHVKPLGDVYSAGVTLYYCLSGKLPFDFSTPRFPLAIILEDEPIPIQTFCPDLPRELCDIVHRAMAKNADQRIVSAGVMLRALVPFADPS